MVSLGDDFESVVEVGSVDDGACGVFLWYSVRTLPVDLEGVAAAFDEEVFGFFFVLPVAPGGEGENAGFGSILRVALVNVEVVVFAKAAAFVADAEEDGKTLGSWRVGGVDRGGVDFIVLAVAIAVLLPWVGDSGVFLEPIEAVAVDIGSDSVLLEGIEAEFAVFVLPAVQEAVAINVLLVEGLDLI